MPKPTDTSNDPLIATLDQMQPEPARDESILETFKALRAEGQLAGIDPRVVDRIERALIS